MRAAALLAGVLMLCGCSSNPYSGWVQVTDMARQMFSQGSGITLRQAAAVPYASIGVRIGDNKQILLVLAADMAGSRLWTSASRIALTTKDGRIIQTSGLPDDLSATYFRTADAFKTELQSPSAADTHSVRLVDFRKDFKYSVPVTCQLRPGADTSVTILGRHIAVREYDELCDAATLDWSFTNRYWADQTGFVWQSVQHIHPDADPIQIQVLRPPAS